MTVDTVQQQYEYATGLEDFSLSDGQLPRISIDHNHGQWKVNILEEQTFPELDTVILGLIRGRILWEDGDPDEKKKPMCRAVGVAQGQTEMFGNPADNFPWESSGFTEADWQERDGFNNINLPCANCQLKEWGSHPNGKNPYCSLQNTFALMLNMATLVGGEADPDNEGEWVPAILTLAKTSLKPSNSYMTAFSAGQKPMFSAYTKLKLKTVHKGSRPYSVAALENTGRTDESMWRSYSENYLMMRKFLTTPQDNRTDEQKARDANPGNAIAAPAPTASAPAPAPAPAPEPVATPVATAPATPTAAPPAPPAPASAAPVQAPSTPGPVASVPAPPVAPTAPAPTPAPQPVAATVAPTPADELPF